MKWQDSVRFALSSMRNRFLRTMLTVLGFAVGVGAVYTVLVLGNAGENRVEQEIAKLGVNKVWITPAEEREAFHNNDARAVFEATGAPACAAGYSFDTIMLKDQTILIQVAGYDGNMQRVHQLKLLEGRAFTEREHQNGSLVCIVDEVLAEQFGDTVIGNHLALGHRLYSIIGVIKGLPAQYPTAGNGIAIIPLTSYLSTFAGAASEITLSVQSQQNAEQVAEQAKQILVPSGAVRIRTLAEEINAAREIVRIFVMVLMAVAAVCVLSGGIGVMNVLLLSVRERKGEIGMLKAVGGSSQQICILFLLEAMGFSLFGGGAGIILGILMAYGFGLWIGVTGHMNIVYVFWLMASVTLVGLISGVGPAVMAAKLHPVDALRTE